MNYTDIHEGVFLSRPNRFIAQVALHGKEETCHVKNTGRCKEILIPGTKVFLEKAQNPNRKTAYDLVAAYKGSTLINIDSQAPNKAFESYIAQGKFLPNLSQYKREVTFGHSRFDFWLKEDKGQEHFIEVKGVTLEKQGVALFPDAPTQRGIKHLQTLIEAKEQGYQSHLVFIIQLKGVRHFIPNNETHPAFGKTLKLAKEQGVHLHGIDCIITPNTMVLDQPIPILLP